MSRTTDLPDPDLPASDYQAGSAAWWDERYRCGDIPWDTGIVPPEVEALLAGGQVRTGWALDLGCGSGLSSRYMAGLGFRVVGVDLALRALVRATAAARAAHLPAYFCLADVSQLAFLNVRADFALDVGCFHAVARERRADYISSLADRLLPGAFYLLYAFTLSQEGEDEPSGISPVDIGRFAPRLVLRWVQHGRDRERPSAWYLMQRA